MTAALARAFPAMSAAGPLCIAHRGARAHAPENTLRAFDLAADLGAQMWELDLRLTADGVPVVSHDARTGRCFGVDLDIAAAPLSRLRAEVPDLPTLAEVIALARLRGCGLYVELKAPGTPRAALRALEGFGPAALGSFEDDLVRELVAADCAWPVAVLVRAGEDPLARAAATGADIVHLCWENAAPRPQDLLTPDLLGAIAGAGLGLVLWHEERPDVLADLMRLPALAICTDQPERMRGRQPGEAAGIEIVCHRGLNHAAPENTAAAARLAYDVACDWIELDVHETACGEIVVIHDATVDRTSDGTGAVRNLTLAQLRALDFGAWKGDAFAGERIQTLAEAIALCRAHGRRMYIENKAAPVAKVWDLVTRLGFEGDCFFWSGDMAWMRALRALAPGAQIKSNAAHHGGFDAMLADLAPQICEIQLEDWAHEAPLCRAHGIRPMLQYFGADVAVFARIARLRPEMINLDRADLMLAALRAQGGTDG